MMIQKTRREVTGVTRWARSSAANAKGKAKIECSNFIIRPYTIILREINLKVFFKITVAVHGKVHNFGAFN
jgi:hypothetical protein